MSPACGAPFSASVRLYMWRVEFTSDMFLPFLPETAQSNPGVYGFELASWLCQKLAKRGVATAYPLQEDWGWLLVHSGGASECLIGCSSVCGEGAGYEGQAIEWSIFVDPQRSLKQKLKGVSGGVIEGVLADHIAAILKGEGITWTVVE